MSDPKSPTWWEDAADKVLGTALDVIKTKMIGMEDTGGKNAPYVSTSNSSTKWLPYAIGAAAIGGIILIMSKR